MLVAIGIVFGSRVAEWRAEQTGVPRQLVSDFLVHVIVIGLLLVHGPERGVLRAGEDRRRWAARSPRGSTQREKCPSPTPGLSSFGGFIGGTPAALWFRQKRRVSLMVLGDIFCFAFPFAWIFGRTGCFVVHDHPGVVSDFFLAVDNYNGEGVARHDLGLYEVIWSAAMIAARAVAGHASRGRGASSWRSCRSATRRSASAWTSCARGPAHGGDVRYFGLTPGHYAAIVMLLAGIAVAVRVAREPQRRVWLDGAPPGDAAGPDAPRRVSRKAVATRRKQARSRGK